MKMSSCAIWVSKNQVRLHSSLRGQPSCISEGSFCLHRPGTVLRCKVGSPSVQMQSRPNALGSCSNKPTCHTAASALSCGCT